MSPIRTWTIYPDYGNSPIVWERVGIPDSRVGTLVMSYFELHDYLPDDLANDLGQWYKNWLKTVRSSFAPGSYDWQSFYQDGLHIAARMALWLADLGIVVRMSMSGEDPVGSLGPDVWLTPSNVRRYFFGTSSISAEPWEVLCKLWERARDDTLDVVEFQPFD